MTYTNKGLVAHAEKALALKTKYMWGGILRSITNSYIGLLQSMYGSTQYPPVRVAELKKYVGKGYYGVDCIGLIKSYYWSGNSNGGTGSPNYLASTDCNAGTMYARSKNKGLIKDLPDVPGLIVYSKSNPHVGIYIGQGMTIESTLGSRGDGVVKRPLDNLWEYWFECPYISYESEKLQTVTLAYPAVVRDTPSSKGKQIGRLNAKTKVTIVRGSDTKDYSGNYVYVKLGGGKDQWIVKSAILGGTN